MTPMIKTLVYVAAAAVLVVVAALSSPGGVEPVFFSDVGEPFFPHLESPDQAASLEIWGFDAETGEAVPFSVKKDGGTWKIPSHYDYPADAKDRMAKAAGLFIGLTKASVRSDSKEDHAKFGVVDPTAEGVELEGRGMRVTLEDKSGAVLADVILGNEVEGHPDVRYVRLADKKRTYTAKLPGELSTKFEDWIERDLLKTGSWDIERVVFDNYSVDEDRGVVVPGEQITMEKKDYEWTLAGLGEDEEIAKDKANDVVTTLTGLKIVDVRRKPDGLTAQLEQAQGISRELLMEHLARRGYFVARNKLYSNEGDLLVHTKKGIVYTLKFGEIVYGSGDAVDASKKKGEDAEVAAEEGGETKTEEASRRYLMITAHFDESLLDAPEGTPLPEEHLDKRKKAREEIEKIVGAVRSYREANDKLPAALADLTVGEGPPLATLEKDPWGRDYVLVVEATTAPTETKEGEAKEGEAEEGKAEEGTEEPGFVVLSYAEDGVEGGEGTGADVASNAWAREDELRKVFDDHQAHKKKVEDGKKEADELSARFGPWYYVIDAASFGKLHLSRSDLVKAKEKPAEGAAGEAAKTAESKVEEKSGAGNK